MKNLDEQNFQFFIKAFETAFETRKLEILLFWKRSLFFWGFIASAFIAYAWLHRFSSDISVLIACFGFACSVAWSLGNRGSKYWQESWETKTQEIMKRWETEDDKIKVSDIFFKQEAIQKKGCWLQARKFSVSKLAIALSDYTIFLWLSVIVWEFVRMYRTTTCIVCLKPLATIGFTFISLIWVVAAFVAGRTTPEKDT
jgi:hypothetical protein